MRAQCHIPDVAARYLGIIGYLMYTQDQCSRFSPRGPIPCPHIQNINSILLCLAPVFPCPLPGHPKPKTSNVCVYLLRRYRSPSSASPVIGSVSWVRSTWRLIPQASSTCSLFRVTSKCRASLFPLFSLLSLFQSSSRAPLSLFPTPTPTSLSSSSPRRSPYCNATVGAKHPPHCPLFQACPLSARYVCHDAPQAGMHILYLHCGYGLSVAGYAMVQTACLKRQSMAYRSSQFTEAFATNRYTRCSCKSRASMDVCAT